MMRSRFATNPLGALVGPVVPLSRIVELKAENEELRRRLAAKGGQDVDPADDKVDDADEGDTDGPHGPKRGKKKAKDEGTPDQADPEDGSGDDRAPPPKPAENDDRENKDALVPAYERAVRAAVDTIVLADAARRGVSSAPKPMPTASERRAEELSDQLLVTEVRTGFRGDAAHTARQICACHRVALGLVEPPPMPVMSAQPDFFGQSNPDPGYWKAVNNAVKFVTEAHYRARGKKIGD